MKNYISPNARLEALRPVDVITFSVASTGSGDDWDVREAFKAASQE